MDSAVASVTLIGGGCAAGAALTQCQSGLFTGDAGGRSRLLIILMAGKSSDDVSSGAGSLKTAGVKIIAVGMGGSFDQGQLSSMAFSSSYVVTASSFSGLAGIKGQVTTLISQGTCENNLNHTVLLAIVMRLFLLIVELPARGENRICIVYVFSVTRQYSKYI